MINNNIDVKVHNSYKAKLIDKNGEIKQEGYAENVVTNRFWEASNESSGYTSFRYIAVGTGLPEEGNDVSPENTSLYNQIGVRIAEDSWKTYVEIEDNVKTAKKTSEYIIPATETYSGKITEVGIFGRDRGATLNSHALFKDSEGNSISIEKEDTDIMIIEVNIYVVIDFGQYIKPYNNLDIISKRILTEEYGSGFLYNSIPVFLSTHQEPLFSDIVPNSYNNNFSVGAISTNWNINKKERYIDYNKVRSRDVIGNKGMANYINIRALGTIKLPNESFFPEYTVETEIGIGDGEKTEFTFPFPEFIENSETVTINGVALSRDLDYSLEHDNNSIKMSSSFESGKVEMVRIGFYPKSTTDGRRLHAFIPAGPDNSKYGEGEHTVEFKESIYAEGAYLGGGTRANYSLSIDYKDDSDEWVRVLNINSPPENGSWNKFEEPIEAKEWKVTLTGAMDVNTVGQSLVSLGKKPSNIVFKEPPADKSVIEVSCRLDRPFKSIEYLFDSSYRLNF